MATESFAHIGSWPPFPTFQSPHDCHTMPTLTRKYHPLRETDAQADGNWNEHCQSSGATSFLFRSLVVLLTISISITGLSIYSVRQKSSPCRCLSDFGAYFYKPCVSVAETHSYPSQARACSTLTIHRWRPREYHSGGRMGLSDIRYGLSGLDRWLCRQHASTTGSALPVGRYKGHIFSPRPPQPTLLGQSAKASVILGLTTRYRSWFERPSWNIATIQSRQSIIYMLTTVSPSFGKTSCAMQMTRLDIRVAIISSPDLDKGKRVSAETGIHSMDGPRSGLRASKRLSLGLTGSPTQIDTSLVRMVASLGRLYRSVVPFKYRFMFGENFMITRHNEQKAVHSSKFCIS